MSATTNALLEAQVLSCVMQDESGRALEDVRAILVPADFQDPRLELIYQAILDLAVEEVPYTPLALVERLDKAGNLRRVGGDSFILGEIAEASFSPANAGYYADAVRQFALRRRTFQVAKGLAESVQARPDTDPEVLRQEALAALEAMELPSHRNRSAAIPDIWDQQIDQLDQPATYIPTPWKHLNDYIDGWRPGALYVIGARTSQGKTMVGLNAAKFLSGRGWVPFVSVEMNRGQLFERLLANIAEVPLGAIAHRNLTDFQWARVVAAREKMRGARIHVIDGAYEGFRTLRSDVLAIRREKGALSAIVCDYLGLMLERGSSKARWEQMAELTADLKALAIELDVPVIALQQLNRASASGERAPTLTDLRDGGSVEQDADVVLLLQRDPDDSRGDILKIDVAKNRHGRIGELELRFEGALAQLHSL